MVIVRVPQTMLWGRLSECTVHQLAIVELVLIPCVRCSPKVSPFYLLSGPTVVTKSLFAPVMVAFLLRLQFRSTMPYLPIVLHLAHPVSSSLTLRSVISFIFVNLTVKVNSSSTYGTSSIGIKIRILLCCAFLKNLGTAVAGVKHMFDRLKRHLSAEKSTSPGPNNPAVPGFGYRNHFASTKNPVAASAADAGEHAPIAKSLDEGMFYMNIFCLLYNFTFSGLALHGKTFFFSLQN